MGEDSVNVESRTSSQDKRWTIMAALLGTNTAFMLFQGIEQERNYTAVREVALTIIVSAIPFQGIYFLIYTFLLENKGKISESHLLRLERASAVCQIIGYGSLIGVALMWYNISNYVGVFFVLSSGCSVILIRTVMRPMASRESEVTQNGASKLT